MVDPQTVTCRMPVCKVLQSQGLPLKYDLEDARIRTPVLLPAAGCQLPAVLSSGSFTGLLWLSTSYSPDRENFLKRRTS